MKNIMLLVLSLMLTCCYKKPDCAGYVYSKNNIPMPGVNIILYEEKNYVSPGVDKVVATTNSHGFYYFKFKMRNKHTYTVRCETDSGKALGGFIRDSKHNKIDMKFERQFIRPEAY